MKFEQSPEELTKGVLYLNVMGVEENRGQNHSPGKDPKAPVCQAPLTQSEGIAMPKQREEANKVC